MPDAMSVLVNGATEPSLVSSTRITRSLSNVTRRASFSWIYEVADGFVLDNDSYNFAGASQLDTGTLGFDVGILSEVEVQDSGSNSLFKGVVVQIDRTYPKKGLCRLTAHCRDLSYFVINTPWIFISSLSEQSDRDYIFQFLDETGLLGRIGFDTAKIEEIDTAINLAPPSGNAQMTGRELMDNIALRTGARWYVDTDGDLVYKATNNFGDASFDVSDDPNGTTTFPFYEFRQTLLFDRPSNTAVVLGNAVSAIAQDTTSIAKYGVTLGPVVRDGTVDVTAQVTKIGNQITAGLNPQYNGGDPALMGSFVVFKDGLNVGDLIQITYDDANLSSEEVLIHDLIITNVDPSENRYEVNFGQIVPSLESELQTIAAQTVLAQHSGIL